MKYGFPLRKWRSNSKQFLETVEDDSSAEIIQLKFEQAHKALGVYWNPNSDQFGFKFEARSTPGKYTKRALASDVMRLFDPLGWLAPFIILAKILLQSVWLLPGIGWDDELPQHITQKWIEFNTQINECKKINLPRWLQCQKSDRTCTLHGFADASERAYAAVTYLVVTDSNGTTHSTMIAAKTRVAPTQVVSLPRLELNAAVLLAELMQTVEDALQIEKLPKILWTDSTIVLSWIASPPTRWKTYVANRVARIQSLTESTRWRHVNSEANPADCASRGISLSSLKDFKLWWNGPEFLQLNRETWPPTFTKFEEENQREERTVKVLHERTVQVLLTQPTTKYELLHQYEELDQLQALTAYLLRWKKKMRGPPVPTVQERWDATLHWVRIVQGQSFPQEIETLKQKKDLPLKSSLTPLAPKWCEEEKLLRVGGRLDRSELPRDTKHPIILPHDSYLTTMIIRHAHTHNVHGGVQATLRLLRERFWIARDKSTVRNCLFRCQLCFQFKGTKAGQQMASLPPYRVRVSRPFTNTGVDFAGYFEVKMADTRNAPYTKCYVALFICLSTRAIHLELVRDLSTQSFIEAVKNFAARKGIPKNIYSDNGTNFVGASNELPQLLHQATSRVGQDVAHALAKTEIQWHFNPAQAPHFGGIWESNIKIMKLHLKKSLKDRRLKFDEFYSILARIEAALNSRPLCPLSNDISDDQALTPSHLLYGYAINNLPEPDIVDQPLNLLQRYQYKSRIHQEFWQRWSADYLSQLQKRTKWHRVKPNVAVGQLVLISEDNVPPSQWLMGRITAVQLGADDLIRSAWVLCRGRTISRPIHRLCILPTEDNQALADSAPQTKDPQTPGDQHLDNVNAREDGGIRDRSERQLPSITEKLDRIDT